MKPVIIYIGNFDSPNASAAGKRVFGNALIFQLLGYTVYLVGKMSNDQVSKVAKKYGNDIYFYSFPPFANINCVAYFSWVIKFIRKKKVLPTLIIRYGSPSISLFSLLLYVWAKLHRIPLIVDVVEWHVSSHSSSLFNFCKDVDEWISMALINKLGQGVICISSFLATYYKHSFQHIIIIPPLVSAYKHRGTSINVSKKLIYAGIPFRLGHRVKNKDRLKDRLDIAVRTIAALQQDGLPVSLHVYGLTQTEYLTAFPEHATLIRQTGDSIVFYGRKNMEEVRQATQTMDFTVLLRDKNKNSMSGFSTKVVESMSLTVPVITTDTGDLSTYIKPGKNGFFVHMEDEKVLKDELRHILQISNEPYLQMKDYLYANQDFCYTQFVEPFRTFLSHIIRKENK